MVRLETERLIIRRWKPEDLDSFAALCADPEVMEHFPATLSRQETQSLIDRMNTNHNKDGYSFMACELKSTGDFIGFVGLSYFTQETHFSPCVEVGWRLHKRFWGQGYAPEGAKAVIKYAFEVLKVPEVIAMTAVGNLNSRRVMEKIGMTYNPQDDFDHPKVEDGHRLKRHVLYRIKPGQLKNE
ncbi:GNAT family acetyltransferase [Bdellovibrio bacteriovorus]|uniref:GNAT family acetyltransferase n=2 Tax=Bdellovibrio bacteriovorus TaxID=959 RepID=A0A150WK50_BDEBC|nr:GNAT family acetyltransferase [Bdellovibrio bacteriovorus]